MSREEHKDAIEVSVIFHEGQRMFAVPKQVAQQEPVGEVNRYGLDSHGRKWHGIYWYDPNVDVPHGTKLYTSLPAQRKPLTDEEIEKLASKHLDVGDGAYGTHYVFGEINFARAIEAAHGIKENT